MYKYFTNENDIKEQYRRLALVYHPDRGGSDEIMKEINAEYSKITNNNQEHDVKYDNLDMYDGIIEYAKKLAYKMEKNKEWAHPKNSQGSALLLIKLNSWSKWKEIKAKLSSKDYAEYVFLYNFYKNYWDDPSWLSDFDKIIFQNAVNY